jgi:hypothetical protein
MDVVGNGPIPTFTVCCVNLYRRREVEKSTYYMWGKTALVLGDVRHH